MENNFPEFFWRQSRFPVISDSADKRLFVDEVILQFFKFVESQAHLGAISYRGLSECPGGFTALHNSHESPQHLFKVAYPELLLHPPDPRTDPFSQRRLQIDRLLVRFNAQHQEDLQHISARFLLQTHSSTLLHQNGDSPQRILSSSYPELDPRQHKKACRGYWKNAKRNYHLIRGAIKKYNIKEMRDWYRLSSKQFSSMYGKSVSTAKIVRLLEYWYPDEKWEMVQFSDKINKRAIQRFLGVKLREMFREEVIEEEYKFKWSKKVYVFDFYLPERQWVVEYQGEQHYFSVLKWLSLEDQIKRDQEKREVCAAHGLTMICIPYWWDETLEGLKLILSSQRK
eukprot:TRINITY_DN2525_c0_g1_i1.p1 TRINITY_DN2525_c0_g1~~TRINITY_DN2525_c0_g1_i1.p1  ORF type:complete len:341 (-),score=66.80 TRINITY_DN2525_c0_g1_i1:56-1078(-)